MDTPPIQPAPGPPDLRLPPGQWIRANLFSSPFNTLLTILFAGLMGWLAFQIAHWVLVTAEWTIVRVNLRLFMVGRFPPDQLWRLWLSMYLLAFTVGLAVALVTRVVEATDGPAGAGLAGFLRRFWPVIVATLAVVALTRTPRPALLGAVAVAAFVAGRHLGVRLPAGVRRWTWLITGAGLVASLQVIVAGSGGVTWDRWGGLYLTIFATVGGIALAFPLGLLLALGRRSSLPGVKLLCIAFIEVFRAVPLVTLLFMGQYLVRFAYPTWAEPPSFLARAIIAITLFEAAYIAEIVRGGLQSVPRGQVEAAQAIGLAPTGVMRLVVLPQALRAVIPAMVGQFISLFKDTSLLAIIGFFELLNVAETVTKQDAFRGQGLQVVTLAFAGFLYWASCSTMSRESQRLERRLEVGER